MKNTIKKLVVMVMAFSIIAGVASAAKPVETQAAGTGIYTVTTGSASSLVSWLIKPQVKIKCTSGKINYTIEDSRGRIISSATLNKGTSVTPNLGNNGTYYVHITSHVYSMSSGSATVESGRYIKSIKFRK